MRSSRHNVLTSMLLFVGMIGLFSPSTAEATPRGQGLNQQLGPGVTIRSLNTGRGVRGELNRSLLRTMTQWFRRTAPFDAISSLPPGRYHVSELTDLGPGRLYFFPGKVRMISKPNTDTYYLQTMVKENGKTLATLSGPFQGLKQQRDDLVQAFRRLQESNPRFVGSRRSIW